MSISRTLARIDVPTLTQFLALPDPGLAFWEALRIDEPYDADDPWATLYLGRYWHVVHYLLTGEQDGGEPPLSLAVGIGAPGHVAMHQHDRYYPASAVQAIASALSASSDDDIARRFDSARMSRLALCQFSGGDEDLAILLEGAAAWAIAAGLGVVATIWAIVSVATLSWLNGRKKHRFASNALGLVVALQLGVGLFALARYHQDLLANHFSYFGR